MGVTRKQTNKQNKRRARKRQQRFLEKKAAEKATSPKRATSEAVPKEPESVPKELDLSSEIRYQERTDQYVLVESEPSSPTSSSTHSDSQVSSVALPATLHEEQAILKDFLASNSNIDSDDDFGDTGVCANCRGN